MTAHIPLPGSHRALLPNSRPAGPVDASEIAALTIRLRSVGDVDELEKMVQEQSRKPLAERNYLKREDFASKHGASAADFDLIEDLAHEHNLTVVHRNAAERSIVLRGRLGDLLNAFPADVRIYHHSSGPYRGRQGEIRIPDRLAGIVTGVFGFDTRPKHRASLRRLTPASGGPGGDNGVAATEFATRYHFPTAFNNKKLNGEGQTIAIVELGGGYRSSDLKIFFREIGVPKPRVSDQRGRTVDGRADRLAESSKGKKRRLPQSVPVFERQGRDSAGCHQGYERHQAHGQGLLGPPRLGCMHRLGYAQWHRDTQQTMRWTTRSREMDTRLEVADRGEHCYMSKAGAKEASLPQKMPKNNSIAGGLHVIGIHRAVVASLLTSLAFLAASGCSKQPQSGAVFDEAKTAGRTAASFTHAADDYFHDMDGGASFTPDEIIGRNVWLVWTGGNDRFWNTMTGTTFGAFDLLKSISSHPSLGYSRASRWNYLGLVNEPCFEAPTAPDKNRRGLWLDVRSKDCPGDPFEDETRYPGVAIGSRGKSLGDGTTQPVGSYYGYATGIMGLRLFPNPDFDAKAAKAWDPERYYTDPSYYNRADLVRPYRVGMSCGFCHVGPSPVNPPADPNAPTFANLSSSVGAQYMWVDRLFIFNSNKPEGQKNFMYQLVKTYRPGSMDTSLISTDSINNPRTMNAVYDFGSRMGLAKKLWHEKLAGGELNNKQFGDFMNEGPLTEFYAKSDATTRTPHVLKDGADSVGLLGALNRVYINIGLFSEEWLLHFNAVVGGKTITPIRIADAESNSPYWQATEAGTFKTALFFLKAAQPDRLKDAPGGSQYLSADAKTLARGKEVFADTCARCHSSKAPAPPARLDLDPDKCAGAAYLGCFKRYWTWTQTDEFKTQMRGIVAAPDFLTGNYLSTDARIPVTLLRTNACSPLATNALAGNIWDNFSSQSYKDLPSVGTVTLNDPFTGDPVKYPMPAGGRGYTRVPSLIGIWSTAPFLLNNSVGPFTSDPSVAARMKMFDASIEQMLWPEKRDQDSVLAGKVPGIIDRTTERSQVFIPAGFVPEPLQPLQGAAHRWLPRFVTQGGDIELGPIPKGMPVGLLASLKLRAESDDALVKADYLRNLGELLIRLKTDLLLGANDSDEELGKRFANLAGPMLANSKCPDFVVNRGHYFGTAQFNDQEALSDDERAFGREPVLGDGDKHSLIAFLKTF